MSSLLSRLTTLASASATRTETDIQSDVKALLEEGAFLPGESVHLEMPTGDGLGRIDVGFGALVIECKKVVDPRRSAALADHESQLTGYLAARQVQVARPVHNKQGQRVVADRLAGTGSWLT